MAGVATQNDLLGMRARKSTSAGKEIGENPVKIDFI